MNPMLIVKLINLGMTIKNVAQMAKKLKTFPREKYPVQYNKLYSKFMAKCSSVGYDPKDQTGSLISVFKQQASELVPDDLQKTVNPIVDKMASVLGQSFSGDLSTGEIITQLGAITRQAAPSVDFANAGTIIETVGNTFAISRDELAEFAEIADVEPLQIQHDLQQGEKA